MTRDDLVSTRAYVVVFLMLGLVWNYMPVPVTVHGQTSDQKVQSKSDSGSGDSEEKVIFRNESNSGLWGDDGDSARGGNGGGGGGNGGGNNKPGRGKNSTDPSPTPSPSPTPTPTPTPGPTPNPSPTPDLSSQWDVASRSGVKFYVDHSAWYRVSASELTANGFNTASDSYYWQLFRDGVEEPMTVNTDGSIEFFGSGVDNRYTNHGAYYLVVGDQAGLRVQEANDTGATSTATESYLTQVTEKPRTVYVTSLLNGDEENWWGPAVTPSQVTSIPVELVNVDNSQPNGSARLRVELQGYTAGDHLVNVQFNDYTVGTVSFTNRDLGAFEFDIPISAAFSGTNNIKFQSVGGTYDFSLVDNVSVTFPKRLQASNQKLRFGVSAGDSARVGGFNDSNFYVYEVTPGNSKKRVAVMEETVNGSHGFSLGSENRDREFFAVAEVQKESVSKIEPNLPSSWFDSANSAELLIVAPYAFQTSASQLAQMKMNQGMQAKVVYVEDIMDEFGFGSSSPDAMRSFFQHAVYSWAGSPGYVILFGDSSYDYKNYLGLAQTRNFVPTKMIETFDMETSSDGWLVDFNDDGIEDVSLGRISVANTTEAAFAVSKIARYEAGAGSSGRSAALVADTWFEILNQELQNLLPQDVSSVKIERSVLGDTVMKQQIQDNANLGPSMVSYLGHGTTIGWTSASVFNKSVANGLTNDKLSFYMLMTCLNGYMSDAQYDGFAEILVKAPNAAIVAWASSGSTYASGQIAMSQQVTTEVFTTNKRIGDIVREAKHTSSDMDAKRTWMLFGDPTLKIY